jgi:hypothetical protein
MPEVVVSTWAIAIHDEHGSKLQEILVFPVFRD